MVQSRTDLSSAMLPKSAATDLRFCCAVCSGDSGLARHVLESSSEGVDWTALIELAKEHRLEMLLYRAAVTHLAEFVTPSALEALRKLYADNQARCRVISAELLRLLDRLAGEQIPALAFKGPMFGAQLYGDPALRIYWDLDLLVRECDVAKVTGMMLDQGYCIRMSLSWELWFARPTGESVDVHWSISERIHQFPFTTEQLWARRAVITLAGTSLPTLSAEDTLLVIC